MTVEVGRAVAVGVVHREEDLAPGVAQPRPAVLLERLAQRRPAAADVVWRQQVRLVEHRADLGVERVERGTVDRQRLHQPDVRAGRRAARP